jgi:hypothetical protein
MRGDETVKFLIFVAGAAVGAVAGAYGAWWVAVGEKRARPVPERDTAFAA